MLFDIVLAYMIGAFSIVAAIGIYCDMCSISEPPSISHAEIAAIIITWPISVPILAVIFSCRAIGKIMGW
jgi:hypothetical protein